MLRKALSGVSRVCSSSICRQRRSITVTFKDKSQALIQLQAKEGDTVLMLAHRHEVDLEGACEGVCACSTCHVYVDARFLDTFDSPSEEEEDVHNTHPSIP